MASLLDLPPELLLEIHDLLPPDAILALKLTHPLLDKVLPTLQRLRNKTLTECARFALERYTALSTDNPTHLRCLPCRASVPIEMFTSSCSPACLSPIYVNGPPKPEVVDLPPFYCAWHVSRLARVVRTEPGGKNEWVSDVKRMCMHGSCIEGWSKCDCECDSCGYQMVRTYTRYLDNDVECKLFRFWRNIAAGESEDPSEKAKGRLFVKEDCRDVAADERFTLDLPVRYLNQTMRDGQVQDGLAAPTAPRSVLGSFSFDRFSSAGAFLNILPSS